MKRLSLEDVLPSRHDDRVIQALSSAGCVTSRLHVGAQRGVETHALAIKSASVTSSAFATLQSVCTVGLLVPRSSCETH